MRLRASHLLVCAVALLVVACAGRPTAANVIERAHQADAVLQANEAAAWMTEAGQPKKASAKGEKEVAAAPKAKKEPAATKTTTTKAPEAKEADAKKTTKEVKAGDAKEKATQSAKASKKSPAAGAASSAGGPKSPKSPTASAAAAASSTVLPTEPEFEQLFAEYKQLHKRKYKSPATEARAFTAFKNRYRKAVERNQRINERRAAKAKAAGKPPPPPKTVFDPLLSPLGDLEDAEFKKRYLAGRPKRGGLPQVAVFKRTAAIARKAASKARFLQQHIRQLPDPMNFPVPGGDNLGKRRVGGDNLGKRRIGGDNLGKRRVGGEDISDFEINQKNIEEDKKGVWKINPMGQMLSPMKGITNMEIDLSTSCFPSRVRNQGECRSCWAVTAVEHFQAVLAQTVIDGILNGGQQTRLSAQQIVDCQRSADDQGCDGGTVVGAFDYIQKHGIVASNAYDFPLDGTQHACTPVTLKQQVYGDKLEDWRVYKAQRSLFLVPPCLGATCDPNPSSEATLLEFWRNPPYRRATSGVPSPIPVVAYVDSSSWGDYAGGIFDASECSSAGSDLIHIVQIVGFGTDIKSQKPFWLIRNSWGGDWGESGLIRLPYGVNACGLFNYVIYLEAEPTPLGAGRPANKRLEELSKLMNNSPRGGMSRPAVSPFSGGSIPAPVGGASRPGYATNPLAGMGGAAFKDNRPIPTPFFPPNQPNTATKSSTTAFKP